MDDRTAEFLRQSERDWEENEVAQFLKKQPERKTSLFTLGDVPLSRTYSAADIAGTPIEDIGLPGRYPFTRGPYPTMYRSRLWTMRQIAGFGTGEDTNQRFKYLIAEGQTGTRVQSGAVLEIDGTAIGLNVAAESIGLSGNGTREPGTEALYIYSSLKSVYVTVDPGQV